MPTIYLSPSTQENNLYVNGGTEEEWMNRLADAMVPYLVSSGIQYVRNTPDMTAASSIRASNQGRYDLHLALHSNAAPEGRYGQVRGIIVYYYPGSTEGKRAAEIVADNLKAIYPLPNLVSARSTTAIGEVRRVKAPVGIYRTGLSRQRRRRRLDPKQYQRRRPQHRAVADRVFRHSVFDPGAAEKRRGRCLLGRAEHSLPAQHHRAYHCKSLRRRPSDCHQPMAKLVSGPL